MLTVNTSFHMHDAPILKNDADTSEAIFFINLHDFLFVKLCLNFTEDFRRV
jgi:predicted NodU family carbamoyl transferase